MEAQLAKTPYIAGDAFTLADIALYAYTHSAETRGGFDLSKFPHIQAWLKRCQTDPGHVPIEWGCE
jgi:glutathione S-transferase